MFDKVPPRTRRRPRTRYLNRLRRKNPQSFPPPRFSAFLTPAASIALSESTAEGKGSQPFLTGFGRSFMMQSAAKSEPGSFGTA